MWVKLRDFTVANIKRLLKIKVFTISYHSYVKNQSRLFGFFLSTGNTSENLASQLLSLAAQNFHYLFFIRLH